MARKKKTEQAVQALPPRPPMEQPIVDTIEKNYMHERNHFPRHSGD